MTSDTPEEAPFDSASSEEANPTGAGPPPAAPDDAGTWVRDAVAAVSRTSTELGYAIERDELIMYGQPVVDLHSGRVVAVESLLRWAHSDRSIDAPGQFLDVAEAADLIIPIGRRVLRESCRIAATWVDRFGSAAPAVHVNISGHQLDAGNLREEVLEALSAFGLEPSQLVLELPEVHMPLIAYSLRKDLQNLRDQGVKVAIDDLGTRYGSLTRLTELPADMLKIDRSFIAEMETDAGCAAVVRGILTIGDARGLEVVAKGVETPSQALLLADYGCTRAQGYLYSRPMPEPELLRHIAENAPSVEPLYRPPARRHE